MSSRALIIDDHAVVRSGIRKALEVRGEIQVFEAASKAEALAQIAHVSPHLIVVDINLPDGSGLEIVSWVRTISTEMAIVVLTFNDSDDQLLAAMKAGASAFVNKSAPLPELMAAVAHAQASPRSFAAQEIVDALQRKHLKFGLSQRELQIITMLPTDEPLSALAKSLFISESTLKTHLTHIYRKMSVKNRLQAINVARKAGLL
ncbi:CitB Response regulator containing a CheY-like receiver domain and an HTH DNA-binding domain [Candidatus Nanopelagicaceae bacterium]